MIYPEIGSYFWLEKLPQPADSIPEILPWLPETEDQSYTFSGRSAIELAVLDIMSKRKIKKAYVPSYCCESMLQAFRKQQIKLEFYNVSFKAGCFKYDIDTNTDADVVLLMSYFGFQTQTVHSLIDEFHQKGRIVIEDITHSLFNDKCCSTKSDYLVASLRKWFAVPAGGWIGKRSDTLFRKPDIQSSDLVKDKLYGMLKKWEYISGKSADKADFFKVQTNFEKVFLNTDSRLLMDSFTGALLKQVDIDEITSRRRENAGIIRKGLQKLADVITLPYEDISCISPLFCPVFLELPERDSLRSWLIINNIYCPVHWPAVEGTQCDIVNRELSLICDHRYSEQDMLKIVLLICEWYEKYHSQKTE